MPGPSDVGSWEAAPKDSTEIICPGKKDEKGKLTILFLFFSSCAPQSQLYNLFVTIRHGCDKNVYLIHNVT